MKVKLVLEYDGTDFRGSQRQKDARTVQQTLEEAISAVWQFEPRLHLAGRTDAGVHARGQVADFELPLELPPSRIRLVLNEHLPSDLRVRKAEQAEPDFHSRFDAVRKTYGYYLWLAKRLPISQARYVYQPEETLDLESLTEALRGFEGEHDFLGFSQSGSGESSSVRRLERIRFFPVRGGLLITLTGPGFLRKMVRMLVGAGLEVAMGKATSAGLAERLEHPARQGRRAVAPAKGLWLLGIRY